MTANIEERLRSCLERQIAWLEAILNACGSIDDDLETGVLERVESMQRRFAVEGEPLRRELDALQSEFELTRGDKSDEVQGEVRELAQRAQTLCAELQRQFRLGAEISARQIESLRESFGELTRGKRVLGKYRAADDPRFIDRKA